MTQFKKISRYLLAGAGILAALLAALVLLAPRFVNTEAFRNFALAELEQRTGIRGSYGRAQVSLSPLPRVVVQGAVIEIPGVARGKIGIIEVFPEPIPLLIGTFRLSHILLDSPNFQALIPSRPKPQKVFSVAEFEGKLSALLDTVQRNELVKNVTIRNGRLDLFDGDGPIVSLRDLNARVGFPAGRVTRIASPDPAEDVTFS